MAYDDLVMLRKSAAGDLTTSVNGTGVDVKQTAAIGMSARITVPQATGTTPKVVVEIQSSDSLGSGYLAVGQSEEITAAGEYFVRFATSRRYVRYSCTVTGSTPNFGAVEIGLVAHGF